MTDDQYSSSRNDRGGSFNDHGGPRSSKFDRGGRDNHDGTYHGGNRGRSGRTRDQAYANQPARRREGLDDELISSLHRLDGRNYGSYKSLIGDWDFGAFSLAIDRVQADPYAPPSSL